ncbi:RNA polymerase sigma-70 factor [Plebeiibacterium marinum]|uniref:RNA polymerase sigma-70 factor n=1 Tax=Plebeiibacterium marinum TaxID=2992111 RepID=A0AAE3MBK2_9BACT|nr:RNA polymerase sigma-70 factor [Plebeiobacterium marinum]MCW3804539.1 RNA polymerase sigma-70 factor [Plebeiobacterium marinum]
MTGEKLFYRIKRGDVSAFEELFRQFYPSMCVVAKSYVKDDTFSEDIVQEAFIKLWNSKENYNDINSLKSFLYVMVKNLSLNHLRKDALGKKYTKELDNSFQNDISHKIVEEESYRIIYEAVNNLPNQTRNVMHLSLKGMQNQDIADNLGISVNTVKTLKYNALKTLRVVLKDYYVVLLFLLGDL